MARKEKTSVGSLTAVGSLPRILVESLQKIDPDVRAVLPKAYYEDGVFREGVTRDWDESMKLWQETYRALKKRYPGPTPQAETTQGCEQPLSAKASTEPLYRGKPAAYWLEQLKDGDPKFRVDAVEALGNIAQKNEELIPVVAGALSDKDYEVGSKAAEVLGGFGPDIVPVLVDALKDKRSPAAIRNAAMAVQRIGPEAKAAVPALSQTLRVNDWGVRRASIIALGNIGPDAKPGAAGNG